MYLLTLYGCFFNLVFILLFNRFISVNFLKKLVIFSLFLSFLCSLVVFYEVVVLRTVCFLDVASWIQAGFLNLKWTLIFDSLSVTLLCVVLFVSLLVHLYSLDYMAGDPHLVRFIFSLSLFTFFMLLMITSNNVLQLFLGWEGVGLSSYLLINFWFGRLEANKSAIKAIVVNRIGDFGLYSALLFLIFSFKTLSLGSIFALSSVYEFVSIDLFGFEVGLIAIISSFVFLGTMGKSAQIGLHMWLPDAMEGPTPVSALLHAATMVTAGVFVLMRFSVLVAYVPYLLVFISVIGFATTFFAGFSALFQYDIKKIIAYSTCSHLGIMLILCGFSHYDVAVFHLFNHAFFKALLFLSAGAIIHSLGDEQDIRKMGALVFLMPFTYTMFLVGSLSLIGFPFLSGFFSKDRAWELFFSRFYDYSTHGFFLDYGQDLFFFHKYAFFFFTGIVILSVGYAFRLVLFVFPFFYNGFRPNLAFTRESTLFMWVPLLVLSFFSILAGYLFKDLFVGLGSNVWFNSFPRAYFVSDFSFPLFQEIFFSSNTTWNHFFLRLFTFSLSIAFLFVLSRSFYSKHWSFLFPFFISFCRLCFFLVVVLGYSRLAFFRTFFVFIGRLGVLIIPFLLVFFFSFYFAFFYALMFFVFSLRGLTSFSNVLSYHYSRGLYRSFQSWLVADHFFYRWLSTFFAYLSYHVTFKAIDRGFIEYFGPFGVVQAVVNSVSRFNLFFFRPFFFSFLFVLVFSVLFVLITLFFVNCFCFLKYSFFVILAFSLLTDR